MKAVIKRDVIQEIREFNDAQAAEEAVNPLAKYSTLQLKKELSRRKAACTRRGIFACLGR